MKRIALAALAVLLSTVAYAVEKPDYVNDTENYACDNEQLADHLKVLYSDPEDVIRVLFVKNATELSRTADGLKCKITLVHQRGRLNGIVQYRYEDGHALYGFKASK